MSCFPFLQVNLATYILDTRARNGQAIPADAQLPSGSETDPRRRRFPLTVFAALRAERSGRDPKTDAAGGARAPRRSRRRARGGGGAPAGGAGTGAESPEEVTDVKREDVRHLAELYHEA
ncbi:hypothetical protein BV20DRAFT_1123212 [Pilatotrama ljubarskyi]|nr:hypothetical protein BV20DRAFT_1123212 [Pilatotrama ljubarskyi]